MAYSNHDYQNHRAQLRCTREVWADRDGLTGKEREDYLKDNHCGGFIVSGYDTLEPCPRCPDDGTCEGL